MAANCGQKSRGLPIRCREGSCGTHPPISISTRVLHLVRLKVGSVCAASALNFGALHGGVVVADVAMHLPFALIPKRLGTSAYMRWLALDNASLFGACVYSSMYEPRPRCLRGP